MTKTETSSFGTGRRESHDSSGFYERSLYEGILHGPVSAEQLAEVKVPDPGSWVDQIYCETSENMSRIPDNSVALSFTSPPYNVGKDYDDDMGLEEYLGFIRRVAQEVYRVLRPGGRYVVNVANLGRKPYIPLHALFYTLHMDVGFLPMGEIIWLKARGASGSCAWGSWLSAKAPRLRDIHEYLLVFAKQSYSRPDIGVSDIDRDEFMSSTLSVWEIPAESASRVGHPAPFPVELAQAVIKLYSYAGDVVLDPFVGSGTTCIAAVLSDRHYVGFDTVRDYCEMAEADVAEAQAVKAMGMTLSQRRPPMAHVKTETTELSLAFGILGVEDPLRVSAEAVTQRFQGTLHPAKYERFRGEFARSKNQELYQKLHGLGVALREHYPPFHRVAALEWCGPRQQAQTTSASIDLLVANTPVSVKAGSDIVRNFSPHNLFISLPEGSAGAQNAEHWYLLQAPEQYQALYSLVRSAGLMNLPPDVAAFEERATKQERKMVQETIRDLPSDLESSFDDLYLKLCHEVAARSAEAFNDRLRLALEGKTRKSVLEGFARHFFRLESVAYVLAGIERRRPFAVVIPQLTEWKSGWRIQSVEAVPNLRRKQSVVDFLITCLSCADRSEQSAKFHAQIRWSHGKFGARPEARLYKDFSPRDVVFFDSIV
jgi:DNA modification methylase